MKSKILLPFAFAGQFILSSPANSQTITTSFKEHETIVTPDTSAQLTLVSGRYREGKTYLHWNAKGQQCDGLYTIYRSSDGENYMVLGHKQGIGVPISVPIAYYFQDEAPPLGTTWYKLVHIGQDNTYINSEEISVTRKEILLTGTK